MYYNVLDFIIGLGLVIMFEVVIYLLYFFYVNIYFYFFGINVQGFIVFMVIELYF